MHTHTHRHTLLKKECPMGILAACQDNLIKDSFCVCDATAHCLSLQPWPGSDVFRDCCCFQGSAALCFAIGQHTTFVFCGFFLVSLQIWSKISSINQSWVDRCTHSEKPGCYTLFSGLVSIHKLEAEHFDRPLGQTGDHRVVLLPLDQGKKAEEKFGILAV